MFGRGDRARNAMGRLTRKLSSALVVAALPLAVYAQTTLNVNQSTDSAPAAAIGGTPSIDIITLRSGSTSAPLRFGNVVSGSEHVELAGRALVASRDYAMDYGTGVVYLKVLVRDGDVATVAYRYNTSADPKATSQYSGIAGFKYTLVPGGLNMLMGLGLTERASDGSVMSSNVFGFNNSTNFGQGAVKGLFLYGQRQKNDVSAGLQMKSGEIGGNALNDQGDSKLIVQSLNTKALGGTVSVDYQDVSKNFASFQNAADAGYDVSKLQKERGLTRFGYSLQDMKFGGLGFSNSFRNVVDDGGGIEWRTYGVSTGGLKLNYTSQRVDTGFTRFNDIAEGDRAQLAKERGLERQGLSGELSQKLGKLSFDDTSIQDVLSGKSIERRKVRLDTTKINFELGDQDVASGFSRFDSLMGQEKALWGAEAGLRRQWTSVQTSLFGSQTPLAFSQSIILGPSGNYKAQDASFTAKTWSLQHSVRASDSGFASAASMQGDELNNNMKAIANMYGQGINPNGNDRNYFIATQGVTREFTSVQSRLFKGWDASLSTLSLRGAADHGGVDTATLTGKNASFSYRRQSLGSQFSEVASLMEFERQRIGSVSGMERTDLGMNFMLGGSKKLTINKLSALVGGAGLSRTNVAFSDKKIDVQVNAREVDTAMTGASSLVDSEKDVLQSLAGYKERDARVKWQLMPNMKVDFFDYNATNSDTTEDKGQRQVVLDWSPNKTMQVGYVRSEQNDQTSLAKLFSSVVERISVNKDLGRYGKVSFYDENATYDGTTNTTPDRHTKYVSLEAPINKLTSIRTEQTRTSYDNGDKEDINSNTISTAVAKNAGISVTETKINRNGGDNDETKRNYGFWIDLGHGLKVNYGYARQLNGDQSTMSSTFTMGSNAGQQSADKVNQVQSGQVGNMLLGGGYGTNYWDGANRTQSYSNVSVSLAKPVDFGAFKNLKLAFSYDTAADYSAWLRENRFVSVSSTLLGTNLGYEYKGQMTTAGDRGIDRAFKFETPQADKNWLRASIYYKARTLPNDQNVAIRDFTVSVKPSKVVTLEHHMFTNKEVARGDALLGSITEADRTNQWNLNWQKSANMTIGGTWKEALNDSTTALSRTAGLTLKLNEAKGSPLTLFYGLEQVDGNVTRQTRHRYSFQFDQKPGPNQIFSMFFGDISYQHSIADNASRNNFTVRMDYQLKF